MLTLLRLKKSPSGSSSTSPPSTLSSPPSTSSSSVSSPSLVVESEQEDLLDDETFSLFLPLLSGSNQSLKSCESLFPELYSDVKHVNKSIRSIDAMKEWVSGYIPPPPCNFSSCRKPATSVDTLYCPNHQCQCPVSPPCELPKDDGLPFCKEHICSETNCMMLKLLDNGREKYCLEHACFVCRHEGVQPAMVAEERPPRNCCENHRLCMLIAEEGDPCTNLALHSSPFCELHESARCKFKKCKRFGISRSEPYCEMHLNEMKMKTKNLRCIAFTKKKKPCKGQRVLYSQYCKDHMFKEENDPKKEKTEKEKQVRGKNEEKGKNENEEEEEKEKDREKKKEKERGKMTKREEGKVKEKEEEEEKKVNELILEKCGVNPNNQDEEISIDGYDGFNVREEHQMEIYVEEKEEGFMDDDANLLEDEILVESIAEFEVRDAEILQPGEWTWVMSKQQKAISLNAVLESFYSLLLQVVNRVAKEMNFERRQYKTEWNRMNTQILQGSEVIGGTVVSCIGHLDAIQAVQPFAVLVEEASEVSEALLLPTLVSTTHKLDLIGDDRQLQASTNGKFTFEYYNKAHVSMFERLNKSNSSNTATLSVQRRMRPAICDLTRSYYSDLVTIKDAVLCFSKVIAPSCLLEKCEGRGREAPGILPNIFFWTHNGAQKKSSVGVSRINPTESQMVVNLCTYLVKNGVPKKSIAILTPYKGQLMLLQKELNANKIFQYQPRDTPFRSERDSCRISTVDRFQGDEADVIVCSLVLDETSRTQFVSVRNRMIVLLSRARLACYVIGNAPLFSQSNPTLPSHWKKVLAMLDEEGVEDTSESFSFFSYPGPRIGPKLPLCCPAHREEKSGWVFAESESPFPFISCQKKCPYQLPCGHDCNLPCHWPNCDAHKKVCDRKVETPCKYHSTMMLMCFEITKQTGIDRLEDALLSYDCEVKVDGLLPLCSHKIRDTCGNLNDFMNGKKLWPLCNEPADFPLELPCGHNVPNLKCSEYAQQSENVASIRCREEVLFTIDCGHSVKLHCFQASEIAKGSVTYSGICKKKVNFILPHCGHGMSITCALATLFQDEPKKIPPLEVVKEGESYDPPRIHGCKTKVRFVFKCGHEKELPCEKVFEAIRTKGIQCQEETEATRLFCGHKLALPCYLANNGKGYSPVTDEGTPSPVKVVSLDPVPDRVSKGFDLSKQPVPCDELIVFLRKCGHNSQLRCSEAQTWLKEGPKKRCEIKVAIKHPLCGHDLDVFCWEATLLKEWHPLGGDKPVSAIKTVIESDFSPFSDPPKEVKIWSCSHPVLFSRICGHSAKMKCRDVFRQLAGLTNRNPCTERDETFLPCGHTALLQCSQKIDTVKCDAKTEKNCWNFRECGGKVSFVCSEGNSVVSCEGSFSYVCEVDESHSFSLMCAQGEPSHCPACILDNTKALSAAVPQNWFDQIFDQVKSDSTSFAFLIEQGAKITNREQIGMFMETRAQMIDSLVNRLKDMNPWQREIISEHFSPVMSVLPQNHPREFSKKIFHKLMRSDGKYGLGPYLKQICDDSLQELQMLVKEKTELLRSDVSVLVGISFMMKVARNQNPSGKKGKWRSRLKKSGYDSVVEGFNIFLFDFTCFVPTHIVRLKVDALSNYLPKEKVTLAEACHWGFQKITFRLPEMSHVIPQGDFLCDEIEAEVRSALELLEIQGEVVPWDGVSILSFKYDLLSSPDTIQQIGERLEKKLRSFGPPPMGGFPFSGLKAAQEVSVHFPDGHVFAALEYLAEGYRDEGKEELVKYQRKTRTCGEEAEGSSESSFSSFVVNPFVFLAHSRLNDPNPPSLQFLKLFGSLCPSLFHHKWMSKEEISLLSNLKMGGESGKQRDPKEDRKKKRGIVHRWEELKSTTGFACLPMDKLCSMIGLERIKSEALEILKSGIKLARLPFNQAILRKSLTESKTLNYLFLGNPGTGKTTVARLFSEILFLTQYRKLEQCVETSGEKLKQDGLNSYRSLVERSMGGVLFIDEAYQLTPCKNSNGQAIVNEMLLDLENSRGKMSFILAGYEKGMSDDFLSFNPGLSSRFREIQFDNFTETELTQIWDLLLDQKNWKVKDLKTTQVAIRRLVKQKDTKGFGNARAVRKMFEIAMERAFNREDFDTYDPMIIVEDIIGQRPDPQNPKLQKILEDLNQMIGWKAIKENVRQMINLTQKNYDREIQGEPTLEFSKNRLFLGNPGTGKTTCGRLYGEVLKQLGMLSKGEVLVKTASDFTGEFIGQSEAKTRAILAEAQGKVLVIDEAYCLNDERFGKKSLNTIVEQVHGGDYEDIAVLMLGYEKEMKEMLRQQNPGLSRRFSPENAFYFEDYSESELLQIFRKKCHSKQAKHTPEAAQVALKVLQKQKSKKNFGNAGAVATLVRDALAKASERIRENPNDPILLLPQDIEPLKSDVDPLSALDNLLNVENIRQKLIELRNFMSLAEERESISAGNFVFKGPPGTGKTTVAQILGKILYQMDFLASDEVVETSAQKLQARHLGQTHGRVTEFLERAQGGVLFIDEAYDLGDGKFKKEAMNTLLQEMTTPAFARTTIIVAGYSDEMDKMLNRNPGFKSRFEHILNFEGWGVEHCIQCLQNKMKEKGYSTLNKETIQYLEGVFEQLIQRPGWGNGRDVMALLNQAERCRVVGKLFLKKELVLDDFIKAAEEMLKNRPIHLNF